MPYGDELYKPENIIAYTGDIDDKPSVYFERRYHDPVTDKDMVQFGHITQEHDNTFNKGREKTMESIYYDMRNVEVFDKKKDKNVTKNKEYAHFPKYDKIKCFHTSRTPHTKVDKGDLKTKAKLASSIENWKDVKKKYINIYVKDKIQEFKNDKELENVLDQLDNDVVQVADRYINKDKNKVFYQNQKQELPKVIQQERNNLQKNKIKKTEPKVNVDVNDNNIGANASNNVDNVKNSNQEQNVIDDNKKEIAKPNKDFQMNKFSEPMNVDKKLNSSQQAQMDLKNVQNKNLKQNNSKNKTVKV